MIRSIFDRTNQLIRLSVNVFNNLRKNEPFFITLMIYFLINVSHISGGKIESFPEPPDPWKSPQKNENCSSVASTTLSSKDIHWNFDYSVYDKDNYNDKTIAKESSSRLSLNNTNSNQEPNDKNKRTFTLPRIKRVSFENSNKPLRNIDNEPSISDIQPSLYRSQSISCEFRRRVEPIEKST